MKKNIHILTVCILAIAFLFCIQMFNLISLFRMTFYYRVYDQTSHERTAFSIPITDSLADVNIISFMESVNKIGEDNNLFIYKLDKENSNEESYSIYLTDNDIYINDWMLVDGSTKYDLVKTYSTSSKERATRISSFFYPVHITVSSISNATTVDGYYQVINLSGDMHANLTAFIAQINSLYPQVQIEDESAGVFYEYQSDLAFAGGLWGHIALKAALILILTLMLGSKIFKYHRQISIYKMEGYTSFQIYQTLFLKPFVYDLFIGGLISCCLITLYFFGGWQSFSVFIELFLLVFAQLVFLELCASCLIMAIILYTPVVNGLKGKNKLVYVESISFAIKMACAFLIIPYIIPGLTGMKDSILLQMRKGKVEAQLENYYEISKNLPSRYHGYIGQDKYVEVYDELVQEHGLFFFGSSQFGSFEDIQAGKGLEFYDASYEYLVQQKLIDAGQLSKDQIIIALPKGKDFDANLYIDKAKSSLRTEREAEVIYYETSPQTYLIRDLYKQDKARKIPIIYLPADYALEGQLNNGIFVSEDGYEKTKEMFENVFYQHDFQPGYLIESMKNEFTISASIHMEDLFHQIIAFLAIFTALWMSCRFMIQADIDNHIGRYRAAYCEGVHPYSFMQYLGKMIFPTVLGILIFIVKRKSFQDINILGGVIFLILFEILMYRYFLSYYKKEIRLMDTQK